MTTWKCAKDGAVVAERNVATTLSGMIAFERGYVCPECKAKFLPEDTVMVSIMEKEISGGAKLD